MTYTDAVGGATTEIPEEVRRFLDRYIDSVERLEVLLLLQRDPAREWTASSVAAELHISSTSADLQLAKLCSYNLLNVRIDTDLFYWFDPRPPHLARGAQLLAATYAKQRLSIITYILEQPAGALRDFAEAFRLTKKGD